MAFPWLNRRALLKGLGGVAIPLPALEAMLNANGTAFGATAPPSRFLVCFGGFSLRCDGDLSPDQYTPSNLGPNYDLKPALAPLGGFNSVKDKITVVSGLRVPGVSTDGSFHSHANYLITGTHGVYGVSSDQLVAAANGAQSTFASLAYRVQAEPYWAAGTTGDEVAVNRGILSYKKDVSGQIVPVVPTVSPKAAFGSLFTGFKDPATDPQAMARIALEVEKRKSILDIVDRRIAGLLPRLSKADQMRMSQHFDEVRQIEKRIAAIPPAQSSGGACHQLQSPGADPAVGGNVINDGIWDVNLGYSDEDARARVMCDLIAMAFTCDLTRAATLLFTLLQSQMNVYPITGHKYGLHDLNHKAGHRKLADAIAWHMKHFGYLVAKLRDTQEGAQSVLDNSAIVFLHEGGYANSGDLAYMNGVTSHTTEGMACLVAGGAGGLKAGQQIVAPTTANHPVNLLITAMNAVGVPTKTLGVVSGSIPALVG